MFGSSALGIGLTMFLRDQFSGPAQRIRNSNIAMQDSMRRTQEESLRHSRNLNAGIALAGAAASRYLFRTIKEQSRFGYEMEFVKSITSATREEATALGKQAMQLGQDTMFFAQDVAEGMRFMAMAGMSAKQVKENIAGAVNLAGATMTQLGGKGGAADIMTNVMTQFKINAKYANDAADMLTYGVTRSNTNLFDMGEAIKYAGSTAMDLNVTLPETIAMVMALGNAGMQGSMAGVAMENAMRYMTRSFGDFASSNSKRALAELGLTVKDFVDNKGNLISMTEAMQKMGRAIDQNFGEGMNVKKQDILQNIFGVRGKRSASLFLRNLEQFSTFTADVSTKSAGHSSRVMSDMMNTLHGQIDRTASAWDNLWTKFVEAISPVAKWVLNVFDRLFTGIQKVLDIPYLGRALATGVTGFVLITTAAAGYRAVVSGLRLLHSQLAVQTTTTTTTAVAGWNAQTAAALRTASAIRAANTSTALGMANYLTMARTIIPGIGGVLGVTAGGRFKRSVTGLTGKAGQFVSGATAMRYAAMYGGGRTVTSTVTTGLLSKTLSFLGGPWALALSFILPAAIGALTQALGSNKNSVDKNTNELSKNKLADPSNLIYDSEFVPIKAGPRLLALQQAGYTNISSTMAGSGFDESIRKALLSMASKGNQSGDIIINIDGETIFRRSIDRFKEDFKAVGIY